MRAQSGEAGALFLGLRRYVQRQEIPRLNRTSRSENRKRIAERSSPPRPDYGVAGIRGDRGHPVRPSPRRHSRAGGAHPSLAGAGLDDLGAERKLPLLRPRRPGKRGERVWLSERGGMA